jgi:hypothetical protein
MHKTGPTHATVGSVLASKGLEGHAARSLTSSIEKIENGLLSAICNLPQEPCPEEKQGGGLP